MSMHNAVSLYGM